ncbi:MAG TPA: hypothetical protein VHA33_04190 [Candidatus Angelobacter sp.]|jgi:hypothetical protein|nr:hypothetical protein [Candidatus Angelobacter sp.]
MHRKDLEDFLAAIEEFDKKYNTPELMRQFLQEAGVIDANGELTPYYCSS